MKNRMMMKTKRMIENQLDNEYESNEVENSENLLKPAKIFFKTKKRKEKLNVT